VKTTRSKKKRKRNKNEKEKGRGTKGNVTTTGQSRNVADSCRGASASPATIPPDAVANLASDPLDALVVRALLSVIAIGVDLAAEGHTTTSLGTPGEAVLMLSALPAILACLLREWNVNYYHEKVGMVEFHPSANYKLCKGTDFVMLLSDSVGSHL